MPFSLKQVFTHILIILGFIVVSLAYFNPVLSGKAIFQSDIMHYIGMSKQQTDFRNDTGEETYWTNSAFGGMPTYQLGAKYPHNYIKKLDLVLRFLPRPADYLFLYFIDIFKKKWLNFLKNKKKNKIIFLKKFIYHLFKKYYYSYLKKY